MTRWTEQTFTTFDGTELFYRTRPSSGNSDRVLLLLHRGHEHSGRIEGLAEELGVPEAACFAFDLRGHGRSPGPRGWARDFDVWVKDLNAFVTHIRLQQGVRLNEVMVVASSVGAVMAVAWVHDYAPPIRGLILAAPAFRIRLYVPFALTFLRLGLRWFPNAFITSYVRSNLLTRDPAEAAAYDADLLITKRIAVGVLVTLFDTAKRLLQDARAIEVPILILSAGTDFVVDNRAQKTFFDAIASPVKKWVSLPGFRHAIFHEQDRGPVVATMREFLETGWSAPSRLLPAIIAKPRAYTTQEFVRLQNPPSVSASIFYRSLRRALVTFGSWSDGMALGLRKGFDSGASLDYVYRHQPSGRGILGTWLDKAYLNAIGWRGVRIRKDTVKTLLRHVMSTLHARGEMPRVLDVAAGHGRYLLECAAEVAFPVSVTLRDLDEQNLEAARQLAQELGLPNVQLRKADAFRAADYADLNPLPNVVVISGLLELFPDNTDAHLCLSAAARVLQPGGYLIYTAQPWHPQLELIARVLDSHRGGRWIMRQRVQAEMDELVTGVGLQKLDTMTDGLGIFTVSVAQKPMDNGAPLER